MAVEGFDAREQLAVVTAGDQDLVVVTGGCLEDGQRAGGEFVRFEGGDLIFAGLKTGD